MIIEKKNDKGQVIWKIDRTKGQYEYCFNKDGSQGKFIKSLVFNGYKKQPSNMNGNGFGFTRVLKLFPILLKEAFQEIESITIEKETETKASSRNKKISIIINKDDYDSYVQSCTEIYVENSRRLKEIHEFQLNKLFPKYFTTSKAISYEKNTISKILAEDNIVSNLSVGDIESIAKVMPELMEKSMHIKKSLLEKLLFIDIGKKMNKIKLSSIISEYEALLTKSKQNENAWQEFLKKNMLFFNSSYLGLIEKTNIAFSISIPDFLLIDQFQCIDVFEIKRPDFNCIAYDKSHDNYYWSDNMSRALSQVSNYLFEIETNANAFMIELQKRGYNLKVVKPKGFILIGKRSELDDPHKVNSFKILADSLKNIQVIFYDDFLESIKYKYSLVG